MAKYTKESDGSLKLVEPDFANQRDLPEPEPASDEATTEEAGED